jgi:signal transduction histidine kinase
MLPNFEDRSIPLREAPDHDLRVRVKRWITALLLVAAAAALSQSLEPWIAPHTTSPYFAAVLLSAVIGGAGPGLFATILASLAIAWFDLGSDNQLDLGLDDILRLAVFAGTALVISYVSAARKTAERDLVIALERLNAVDRAKDEFIATLSHELRTPLTSILGWTHILREPELDEETRAMAVQSIEQSARVQQMLVDDVLDVSRIVLGKLDVRHEPVILQEVIDQSIAILLPEAKNRRVGIESSIPGTPFVIDGDGDRLKQVCWNLLNNAVKFTPSGGLVRIGLRTVGSEAEIEVVDNGEGIDSELLPHIFDRFKQGANGRKGGLGLGLAIVRNIVELHGGNVSAASAGRGRGARFTVRLPLAAHAPASTDAGAG